MNKAILIGRLTKDIELKTTQGGVSVCSFSIAVDRKYKVDGERVTDFFNIVAWRQTAEFVAAHFHKGDKIAVEGEIQTREYNSMIDAKKNKIVEIIAESVDFCESKKADAPEIEAIMPPSLMSDDDVPW